VTGVTGVTGVTHPPGHTETGAAGPDVPHKDYEVRYKPPHRPHKGYEVRGKTGRGGGSAAGDGFEAVAPSGQYRQGVGQGRDRLAPVAATVVQ
jgi:hypothetical protein